MNKLIMTMLILSVSPWALADNSPQSLRGNQAINAGSVDSQLYKWEHDSSPIKRQYIQQPPVIPHDISGYVINLKYNKCLSCHSWNNYQDSKATKISLTHFTDRDGIEQINVAGRRYVCTTCHIAQTDTKPLVDNIFAPISILGR